MWQQLDGRRSAVAAAAASSAAPAAAVAGKTQTHLSYSVVMSIMSQLTDCGISAQTKDALVLEVI